MVILLCDSILKKYCKMANFVLLLLLFIVCKSRAKTTTFEEQNWVETWLIRPSPSFKGIKILKFITDPYDLASLLILAIFVGKAIWVCPSQKPFFLTIRHWKLGRLPKTLPSKHIELVFKSWNENFLSFLAVFTLTPLH